MKKSSVTEVKSSNLVGFKKFCHRVNRCFLPTVWFCNHGYKQGKSWKIEKTGRRIRFHLWKGFRIEYAWNSWECALMCWRELKKPNETK